MSPLAIDGLSARGGDTLPPKLVLVMVGSFVGFCVLIIGFFLMARKISLLPHTSSIANIPLPLHSYHHHGVPTPRRGRVYPTASLSRPKYRDYSKLSCNKGSAPSPELPSPSPSPNERSLKTPKRSEWRLSGTASLDSRASVPAKPATPPPAYAARRGLIYPIGTVRGV